jgi:hypothetical protein
VIYYLLRNLVGPRRLSEVVDQAAGEEANEEVGTQRERAESHEQGSRTSETRSDRNEEQSVRPNEKQRADEHPPRHLPSRESAVIAPGQDEEDENRERISQGDEPQRAPVLGLDHPHAPSSWLRRSRK